MIVADSGALAELEHSGSRELSKQGQQQLKWRYSSPSNISTSPHSQQEGSSCCCEGAVSRGLREQSLKD